VSEVYLQNSTQALCDPAFGSLHRQVQALRTNKLTKMQLGLGTFDLMDMQNHQAEHAKCLASQQQSWLDQIDQSRTGAY
jgi:hypothetical protein